jgi:hypothetical protein
LLEERFGIEEIVQLVAEEVIFGDVVETQEFSQLRELHGVDAVACFKRADGLFADAGEAADVFLTEPAQAAQFSKLQDDVHG